MNDVILKELKIVVERAVRPVRATTARKLQMREELLAHLAAIFEEESKRLGDDQAAIEEAKRRFGDPRELTEQLQETVPLWDNFVRLVQAVDFRGPRESLLHYAARITILTLLLLAAMMLILMPVNFVIGRPSEAALRVYILFYTGALTIPLAVGFILLPNGMYRALYRESVRRWRLAIVYGLISAAFFPVLTFLWHWSLTGDFAASRANLAFASCFAPLAPLLFAAMARTTAERSRQYEEWASLEVDE